MSSKPKNQSKKQDEKMPYFKDYKHRGHSGTPHGHAEWKGAGELYFASEQEYLLSSILNGTFDLMSLDDIWKEEKERVNAAKSNKGCKGIKGTESASGANGSGRNTPFCHNCDNNKALLKKYSRTAHKTSECPFEQSAKQRKYYQKDKIVVDKSSFLEFANKAKEKDEDDSSGE